MIRRAQPLLAIILIIVSVIGITVYYNIRNSGFRVTSVSPSGEVLPTSQTVITFTFNKEIASLAADAVTLEPVYTHAISANKNSIAVKLTDLPRSGSKYTIILNNIHSVEGDTFSKTYTFTGKYVDFKDLPKEEQERQVHSSDSFESSYPLISKLPYSGEGFDITYKFPDSKQTQMPIIITSTLINTSNPLAPPDDPSNLQLLRAARTAAIKWLNKNGYDPKVYKLYFSEPHLVSEFNGTYYAPESDVGD